MRKYFFYLKTTLPLIAGMMMIFTMPCRSQQHVIAQKDVTRPGAHIQSRPAFISSFTATRWEGYNELSWSTIYQQETRKYIVEYSVDGINYQTAAESLADRNLYVVKHQTLEDRPMLYRVRTEQVTGKFYYSPPVMLIGKESASPVKIYPTIVTGTSVTVETRLPVEKIIVYDEKGTQLFTKELGVINERISIQLPSLSKGIYLMSFMGRDGWKFTEKFIVP